MAEQSGMRTASLKPIWHEYARLLKDMVGLRRIAYPLPEQAMKQLAPACPRRTREDVFIPHTTNLLCLLSCCKVWAARTLPLNNVR